MKHIPAFLIINAVRYTIGRQSYAVGEICMWLKDNWEDIDPNVRRIIHRDIDDELKHEKRYNQIRNNDEPFSFFGQDIDRKRWMEIRNLPIKDAN